MFSLLRNRLGVPGIVSIVALVFAMTGGAFAAKDYVGGATSSAKKQNKAGKRGPPGPRGKRGAKGAPGPAGPAGATGPAGPAGAAGAKGDKGDRGDNGSAGTSVTSEEFEGAEGPCADGGVEFTSASPEPAYVCNGEEGSPWSAGGTLPSNATLTGSWAGGVQFEGSAPGSFEGYAAISFPIPLGGPIAGTNVISVPETGTPPANCENTEHPGTAGVGNPEAKPGFLCVYTELFTLGGSVTRIANPSDPFSSGAGTMGATLVITSAEAQEGGLGTFAVTAP